MTHRTCPGEIQEAPTLATWHRYNALLVSRAQASLPTLIRGLYLDLSYLLYSGYQHNSAEQGDPPDTCSSLQWSHPQQRTTKQHIKADEQSRLLTFSRTTIPHRPKECPMEHRLRVQFPQQGTGHRLNPDRLPVLCRTNSNISTAIRYSIDSTIHHSIRITFNHSSRGLQVRLHHMHRRIIRIRSLDLETSQHIVQRQQITQLQAVTIHNPSSRLHLLHHRRQQQMPFLACPNPLHSTIILSSDSNPPQQERAALAREIVVSSTHLQSLSSKSPTKQLVAQSKTSLACWHCTVRCLTRPTRKTKHRHRSTTPTCSLREG